VWLVTGAGSGVGRALAVALASSGAEVILTSRSLLRLEETSRWCQGSRMLPADLADAASVTALAAGVVRILAGRPLAGIVHAAGVAAWTSPSTPSGWSLVPLVNAISPWNLTLDLEESLLAASGRVLFVAGAPFTLKGVQPDLARWSGEQKGRGLALALEAAEAKVSMARVLHHRWAGRASAFAFHPGFVRSHLAEGLPFPLNFLGWLAQPFLSPRCSTGEFLTLDPKATALSGQFVSGRRAVGVPRDGGTEEPNFRGSPWT